MLGRDGAVAADPDLEIIETGDVVSTGSPSQSHTSHVLGELRRVNLEALARMGNQHLRSHPETLPMDTEGMQLVPPRSSVMYGESNYKSKIKNGKGDHAKLGVMTGWPTSLA